MATDEIIEGSLNSETTSPFDSRHLSRRVMTWSVAMGQGRHSDREPVTSDLPRSADIFGACPACLKGANTGSPPSPKRSAPRLAGVKPPPINDFGNWVARVAGLARARR